MALTEQAGNAWRFALPAAGAANVPTTSASTATNDLMEDGA
jgi:hypothetical protein